MPLLSVSNLTQRIGGKCVLWDVTLEVDHGEITGVFGRSDSGKTSLARVIAGIDEPTGGSVLIDLGEGARGDGVSLALSSPAAAADITVYEHLQLFATLWGVSRKRRLREIAFLMELLDLGDHRSMRCSQLSSGALRRLELARALVADAPLTIIDSLLDTLEPDLREKLWEHILSLRRNQRKSFLILTSSSRVAEMCMRLAVIHRGRISFLGRPDDFRRLAGEDVVVLGDVTNPALRNRIQERMSVVIQEEEGFLSFRVANGERVVSDLLMEFGSDLGCVYLKRPTLDDALDVLAAGPATVAAPVAEG